MNIQTQHFFTTLDIWLLFSNLGLCNRSTIEKTITFLFHKVPSLRYGIKGNLKKLKSLWDKFDSRKANNALNHLNELHSFEINYITINDKNYPSSLLQGIFPPMILFFKGKINHLETSTPIGIVGTRAPLWETVSESVKTLPRFFKRYSSPVVISGMARGCDTLATHLARKNNISIVEVLAETPTEIKATEEESFVSEYVWAPAWSFTRRLVLRNRLIASFAEVLVLLQAPLKSGALITATFASLLNKPVYVLKPKKICYATAGGVYFKNNHRKTYWLN